MEKKFVSSHHTKVSTFAIRTIANHNPKIAKELPFFLSYFDTLVQLDTNKAQLLTPPTTTPCRHCQFDNVNKTKTVQRFDNFCKKLHGVG